MTTWGSSEYTWGDNRISWSGESPVYRGIRVSDPIDLSDVGIYRSSLINWDATVPTNTDLIVETSVDEGDSWQLAYSGFSIANLIRDQSLEDWSLLIRITMESTELNVTPSVDTLAVSVQPGNLEELVPLATLGIASTEVSDSRENGMSLTVHGYDRSRKVARNRLLNNYIVPMGSNYGDAIRNLIADRLPGTEFDFEEVSFVTPSLVFGSSGDQGGGDPWKYATEMAQSLGMDLYFDEMGVCCLKRDEDPTEPVWEYVEGPESMIMYVNKRLSDDDTRNVIMVTGESTSNDEPVKAVAEDDNPNSPTYVNGPYGRVPGFFQSSYIRSQAQAEEMAAAMLRERLGTVETARSINIVNPAHQVGDLILIRRARSKVDALYRVKNFTIPLDAQEALTLVMRERRI